MDGARLVARRRVRRQDDGERPLDERRELRRHRRRRRERNDQLVGLAPREPRRMRAVANPRRPLRKIAREVDVFSDLDESLGALNANVRDANMIFDLLVI